MRINTGSPEWIEISEEIARRIEARRSALEAPALDPVRTEFYRGALAELRSLLTLPDDQPL